MFSRWKARLYLRLHLMDVWGEPASPHRVQIIKSDYPPFDLLAIYCGCGRSFWRKHRRS